MSGDDPSILALPVALAGLRNIKKHCTVPSDDVNYDPPKFAPWHGRPKVKSWYAVSCLLFFPVGVLVVFLARVCEQHGYRNYTYPFACSPPPLDGYLLMAVAATAINGDVLKLGSTSYWHPADRVTVMIVCLHALLQVFGMLYYGIVPFFLSGALFVVPCYAYTKSSMAREWNRYEVWHILWHCSAAFNKTWAAVLFFITCDTDDRETQGMVCVMTLVLVSLEVLAFFAVEQHLADLPYEKAMHQQMQNLVQASPASPVRKMSPPAGPRRSGSPRISHS